MTYDLFRDALILTVVFLLFTFSRRTRFRFVIISSGIISGVALYLWQTYEAPTGIVALHAEGRIAESYLSGGRKPDVLFRLDNRGELFRYKRWFPRFAEMETQLRIGNDVGVDFTISDRDSSKAQVWQIASGGRVLVTQDEMVKAMNANARYGLYLGLAFGFISLSLLSWDTLVRRRQREAMPSGNH